MNRSNVSLQINMSPTDLPICRKLLQRQITFWYNELNEIVISIESKKSEGAFGLDFEKNKNELLELIQKYIIEYPKVRYHFIDYSIERNKVLSDYFFGSSWIPDKDYRGGPFYCYFDGIAECSNPYVLHIDSDMILGGKMDCWLQDAVDLLESKENYFAVNPLPGPPSFDFEIKQRYLQKIDKYKFLFNKMSTRTFLIDKRKFSANRLNLRKVPKSLRNFKWYFKNKMKWGYELPEILISEMMIRNKLFRVDTLGESESDICFTLHPVIKPASFIESIPDLLKRIDNDDIPASQRGYYNVCDDFFDFTKYKKRKLLSWK
jgi:hypothetical protein